MYNDKIKGVVKGKIKVKTNGFYAAKILRASFEAARFACALLVPTPKAVCCCPSLVNVTGIMTFGIPVGISLASL